MHCNDHPSLDQFNIQLMKRSTQALREIKLSSEPVSDTPTLLDDSQWTIFYPRDFRLLRSLCIIHWSIPNEFLKWRIHMDLEQMSFSWLNENQKIVLHVLLESYKTCLGYLFLTKEVSRRELFGNILGNDIKELSRRLVLKRKLNRPPIKRVWRRGYRDKGSRVPDHQKKPKYDFSFISEQNLIENRRKITDKTINYLTKYLTNFVVSSLKEEDFNLTL